VVDWFGGMLSPDTFVATLSALSGFLWRSLLGSNHFVSVTHAFERCITFYSFDTWR
jgi:hypothetical protein